MPNNSRGSEERKETEELTPEENMLEIETERVYYKFMSKDGFTLY